MAGETKKYSGEPLKLEMPMRILKALHSATAPGDMTSAELEKQRRSQELLGQLAAPMSGLSWEEFSLSGMKAAWMRLERPHRHARCVLYCHGGGYTSGNLGYSRVLASKLVRSTGLDTLSFEYRLAPEHPYPAALEDAFRAWDHLMYLGYGAKDVVLAGDSAGGNMALVLCLALRRAGRMLPGALLLMSPWTDMTSSGASYSERAEADPILTNEYIQAVREAYAPGADYSRPEFSPLFGDFSAFPPALIQVGTHEILYSDSERLAERMKAAGCYCRLEVWENMWHVFQMAPAKKSAAAMESMAHFLLEVL
ncbi:MAG TPA: alpha/beta hydrolase [Candidatus Scatomorpha stercorigallinarum]|nr:alpha/beta hydrolase [Candidatus Scatomorpha stercorigallinarum]